MTSDEMSDDSKLLKPRKDRKRPFFGPYPEAMEHEVKGLFLVEMFNFFLEKDREKESG